MLVIRYFRTGKKNQPNFKIVVTDKRRPAKGGRFVEELGTYDPVKKRKALKADRIKYWLSVGAQPSDTIHNLLVSEKIIEGKKIDVHKEKKVKEAASAPVGATASQGEKPVPESAAPAAPAEKKPAEVPTKEEKPAEEKPAEPKPAEEAKPKTEEKHVELPKEEKPAEEKPKEETEEKKAEEPPKEEPKKE